MLKRIVSSVNAFLIILSALTVQADDVSITNPSKHPVQFRVFIPTTGFDKTITLQPGETQNAIGTDLWHNALVKITGIASTPDRKDYCLLYIQETETLIRMSFYLPKVISKPGHRACPYTSNLPNCNCFVEFADMTVECHNDCEDVSNAQVIVSH